LMGLELDQRRQIDHGLGRVAVAGRVAGGSGSSRLLAAGGSGSKAAEVASVGGRKGRVAGGRRLAVAATVGVRIGRCGISKNA
jgi:hypothetical protein